MGRFGVERTDVNNVANFLMLLSAGTNPGGTFGARGEMDADLLPQSSGRVFECKTCGRQFSSFQALGGHRASHKKPRLVGDHDGAPKPKTHECHICGLEFSIGQALGGHMRRHRGVLSDGTFVAAGDVRKMPATGSDADGKRRLGFDLNVPAAENDDEFRLLAFTLGLPVAVDSL